MDLFPICMHSAITRENGLKECLSVGFQHHATRPQTIQYNQNSTKNKELPLLVTLFELPMQGMWVFLGAEILIKRATFPSSLLKKELICKSKISCSARFQQQQPQPH